MDKIRVLLAHSHGVIRECLRMFICAQADMEVSAEVADCRATVQAAMDGQAHVVVQEIIPPVEMSLQVIGLLRQQCLETKVVLLSTCDESAVMQKAFESGASGYLGARRTGSDLLSAIRAVHRGEIYLDPEMAGGAFLELLDKKIAVHRPHVHGTKQPLSQREHEVLKFLIQGYTNQEIADQLYLSVKTTETYRARLKRKLSLRSRADLVRYGLEMGVLQSGASPPSPPSARVCPGEAHHMTRAAFQTLAEASARPSTDFCGSST